jgi:hypothetical protein
MCSMCLTGTTNRVKKWYIEGKLRYVVVRKSVWQIFFRAETYAALLTTSTMYLNFPSAFYFEPYSLCQWGEYYHAFHSWRTYLTCPPVDNFLCMILPRKVVEHLKKRVLLLLSDLGRWWRSFQLLLYACMCMLFVTNEIALWPLSNFWLFGRLLWRDTEAVLKSNVHDKGKLLVSGDHRVKGYHAETQRQVTKTYTQTQQALCYFKTN